MPLSCDCYGGCWADHSEEWPRIFCSGDKALKYWREVADAVGVPYGSIVYMDDHVRVETIELVDKLVRWRPR